jgi:hypothetical protein
MARWLAWDGVAGGSGREVARMLQNRWLNKLAIRVMLFAPVTIVLLGTIERLAAWARAMGALHPMMAYLFLAIIGLAGWALAILTARQVVGFLELEVSWGQRRSHLVRIRVCAGNFVITFRVWPRGERSRSLAAMPWWESWMSRLKVTPGSTAPRGCCSSRPIARSRS